MSVDNSVSICNEYVCKVVITIKSMELCEGTCIMSKGLLRGLAVIREEITPNKQHIHITGAMLIGGASCQLKQLFE